MKRILILLTLAFGLVTVSQAQTLKAYLREAENSYLQGDYYAAMKYYGIAAEVENDKPEIWSRLAESARRFNAFPLADSAYRQLIALTDEDAYTEAYFLLAEVNKQMERYDTAKHYYLEYASQPFAKDSLAQIAVEETSICDWAKDLTENPDKRYTIQNINDFGSVINTPYSEFSPVELDTFLFYTGYDYFGDVEPKTPRRPYMQLKRSYGRVGGVRYSPIQEDSAHTAHMTFDTGYSRVYYSICEYQTFSTVTCQLYYRDFINKDSLSEPVRLPDYINLPGYSTSQPNIGYDEEREKEVLFFASDRPGGMGETTTDIWYSVIDDDGTFSDPELVPLINTSGDEVTPFFHSPSQTLYFSSNYSSSGHKNMGGFDVYRSSKYLTGWKDPEHLGHPINSGLNDISYRMDRNQTTGYLASNRSGAVAFQDDQEFCCYDIYYFQNEFQLRVLTYDKCTGEPLPNTLIKVRKLYGPPNEPPLIDRNPSGNEVTFVPPLVEQFVVTSEKINYFDQIDTVRVDPKISDRINTVNLYMQPATVRTRLKLVDSYSNEPVTDASVNVYLVDDQTPKYQDATVEGNAYLFNAYRLRNQRVVISHPVYLTDTLDITPPVDCNEEMELEVKLQYKPGKLQVLVFDEITRQPLDGGIVELGIGDDFIKEFQSNPDGHEFEFEIDRGIDYNLYVTRFEYFPDTVRDIKLTYEMESNTIVQKVYLKRLLPLTVFFNNDRPDPGSVRTYTSKSYKETYENYIRKEEEFVRNYANTPEGRDSTKERSIRLFFQRNVKEGYENLKIFSEQIEKYLEKGYSIQLTIAGYASPLYRGTVNNYNQNLSARRVDCLENHFETYDNGSLMPFIQTGEAEEPSGDKPRLVIEKKPEGAEDLGPTFKEDDDPVYSPTASAARRVILLELKLLDQ